MADRMLRVAVVGCAHGELDRMYATVRRLEESGDGKVDLLLCCGDFQAVRNETDLNALACPPKYRSMNSFWKYYSGQATASCTTVFIGGNHEASNYMWEVFYGGWVAPNIFYLGAAGVVNFGGLRIGGLSGIYKPHDYHHGHFERAPYNEQQKRSIYHVREYEVLKLLQLKEPVDIFLSHDWPRGIARCGDTEKLLRYKDFLRQEIEENTLGSEPASKLLTKLKPSYWFSAHLHVKFPALIQHPSDGKTTKFLALDKCLPGRGFIQILDIPVAAEGPLELTYDKEWMAITRAYHEEFPRRKEASIRHCGNLQGHRDWIEDLTAASGSNLVPPPFCRTAPTHDPSNSRTLPPVLARNPQTEEFLRRLELPYLLDAVDQRARASVAASGKWLSGSAVSAGLDYPAATANDDPNEIELPSAAANDDPNEIELPSDDDPACDGQNQCGGDGI